MNKLQWYKKYFTYVIRHKYYVAIACFRMWLYRQGIIHDWSKFLPSEYMRYMRWFSLWDKSVEDKFNKARLQHINRNPHHRNHRVKHNDDWTLNVVEMPEKYVKEMLCDWRWVGRAFADTEEKQRRYIYANRSETYNRYYKRKDKMVMHENTRYYIESFLQKEKKEDYIASWAEWRYWYFWEFYDDEK